MLSEDDIIIKHIASFIEGYQRFKVFPRINKYFHQLFNINDFDYYGVYFTDSLYFTQHFTRFYNENDSSFAVKQGLYRSFYNPENKYGDIHINKLQSKQLLYLLISYGPLLDGAKKYDMAQKEKYKKMKQIEHELVINNSPTQKGRTQRQKDNAPDLDLGHSMDMKEEEGHTISNEDETKDDDTNDTNNASSDVPPINIASNPTTNDIELQHNHNINNHNTANLKSPTLEQKDEIMFEYEYNERKYTKMEVMDYNNEKGMKYIEIPTNITKLDFSRQLSQNSKLVALTFDEERFEDDDESRWVEPTEIKEERDIDIEEKKDLSDDDYDDDNAPDLDINTLGGDEPDFSNQQYVETERKESKLKLHYDVKWIANLLQFGHKLTFEYIEILDLSYNAWDQVDIILICDAILKRNNDNPLNLKQIYFDGIPFSNELKKSNKAITKLFKAISFSCNKLQHLSLSHCLLRDPACKIITDFYENNPSHSLRIIDLINNNITERGVDILNEISVLVENDNNDKNDKIGNELAFIVGSFYANDNDLNKWNITIKTDDNYLFNINKSFIKSDDDDKR